MKRLQQDRGFSRYSLLLWFLIAATGCASLQRQPLDVLLSDLELLPAQGLAPRFSISMQLINPNNSQIAIEGGSFRLYLENSRVQGPNHKRFLTQNYWRRNHQPMHIEYKSVGALNEWL